jgi:hypothetical protein
MAALSPGTVSVYTIPIVGGLVYAPNALNFALGLMSIRLPEGFLYTPPTTGQLWPRGDYAPLG